jgi:hypothetical protein
MPRSPLLETLVVDSRLGARPLRDFLADRGTATDSLQGSTGRMRGAAEPPQLPLVDTATLIPGELYASAADASVRFYLPKYRVDFEQDPHVTLTWRGPSTDDAPVAELRVALAWDVPSLDDANVLLLPAPHQASLWLRYARPVTGSSPVPSELELGPLQPGATFRQRQVWFDLYDREEFHLLYLAMTQSRWDATLEVRTVASVAMQTVSQLVLGTPDLTTRVQALRERSLLFSQQTTTRASTEAPTPPLDTRDLQRSLSSHASRTRSPATTLASAARTTDPSAVSAATISPSAVSAATTSPSAVSAFSRANPRSTARTLGASAPQRPGLASAARSTGRPVIVAPTLSRTLSTSRTPSSAPLDAASLLRGRTPRAGGLNLDLGGASEPAPDDALSVDLGKRTGAGFNLSDRANRGATETPIRSLRIPPGWSVDLYTDGALSSSFTRLTGEHATLPTAFAETGARSLVVEAPTTAPGPVLPGMPGVTLHADPRFTGGHQVVGIGRHDVTALPIGNDTVSSLRVPDGLTVTLFEHARFVGAQRTFTQDAPLLGDFDGRTSSLTVEASRAIVFAGANFSGKCQAFGPGSYDTNDVGFDAALIGSLRLPVGWTVVLFAGPGFTGASLACNEDTASLGALAGQVRSLRVYGKLDAGRRHARGGVTVFTGPQHTGESATYGPGAYTRDALGVPDNAIRSVRVAPGWRVVLCELDRFSGRAGTLEADAGQLTELDQRVSSLIVELTGVLTYPEPDFGGAVSAVGHGRHDQAALSALANQAPATASGPRSPDRLEILLGRAERDAAPDFLATSRVSRLSIDSRAAVPSRMVSTLGGQPAIAEVVARDKQDVGAFVFIADSAHFAGVPSEFGLTGDTLTAHDLFDPNSGARLATVFRDTLLDRYFYTPNAFRIPRRATPPFLPDVAVLLHELYTQDEQSGEQVVTEHPRVTLLYRLEPTLSSAALEALMALDGRGSLPLLRPIQPSSTTLTLSDMPSADPQQPGDAPLARPDVAVDVGAGFDDALELSYAQFQQLWSREMSPSGQLLGGTVRLQLGDGSHHDVPIEGSLRQTTGEPFDRTFGGPIEGSPGRYTVVLRNRFESPVRLTALRASKLDGGAIATPFGPVPTQVAPGESFVLSYEVSPADAAVLDLPPDIEVAVDPAYATLLPLLMGDKGFPSDAFEITVSVQAFWFQFSSGEPIVGVRVEFDGDLTIELGTDALSRTITLRRDAAAALLGQDAADQYRYRVINLHPSGAGARSAWITSQGDLEVFPATGEVAEAT